MTPKSNVREKIASSLVHQAVVKATWWHKLPTLKLQDRLKAVTEEYGQASVEAATRDLLTSERHGTTMRWSIKPELHVHCRQLLGPMPSEWTGWCKNADGTQRKGKPAIWPPKREGFDDPPAEPDPKLQKLPVRLLADRLHQSRTAFRKAEPGSEEWCELSDEVAAVEAEYARRDLVMPETPDTLPMKAKRVRRR